MCGSCDGLEVCPGCVPASLSVNAWTESSLDVIRNHYSGRTEDQMGQSEPVHWSRWFFWCLQKNIANVIEFYLKRNYKYDCKRYTHFEIYYNNTTTTATTNTTNTEDVVYLRAECLLKQRRCDLSEFSRRKHFS